MHQVVELAAGLRVEAGGRLVEEEQLGPADDADRDVEAAPLPAGERAAILRSACSVRPTVSSSSSMSHGPGARRRVGRERSRRGGSAVDAGTTAGGRARTGAPPRSGPATPRRPWPGRCRARDRRPERIRKPSRISIVVVLPAPLGPSSDHLAGTDVEVHAGQHIVGPVAHPQVPDLDHGPAAAEEGTRRSGHRPDRSWRVGGRVEVLIRSTGSADGGFSPGRSSSAGASCGRRGPRPRRPPRPPAAGRPRRPPSRPARPASSAPPLRRGRAVGDHRDRRRRRPAVLDQRRRDRPAVSTPIRTTTVPRSRPSAAQSTSESGCPGGRCPETTTNSWVSPGG